MSKDYRHINIYFWKQHLQKLKASIVP